MIPFLSKHKELITKTAIVLGMVFAFIILLEISEEILDFLNIDIF